MIDLVLEGAGEEAIGLPCLGFALEIHEGDGDGFGAADVTAKAGEAQAAFFAGFLGVAELELGIQKDDGHVLHHLGWLSVDFEIGDGFWVMRTINDGELYILRYLRRSQADAIGFTHGFEHVRRKLTDLGRDLRHGAAFGTKNGLGMADNGKNHARHLPEDTARSTANLSLSTKQSQNASKQAAIPWPPPTQRLTVALWASVACSWWRAVCTRRAPLAPTG